MAEGGREYDKKMWVSFKIIPKMPRFRERGEGEKYTIHAVPCTQCIQTVLLAPARFHSQPNKNSTTTLIKRKENPSPNKRKLDWSSRKATHEEGPPNIRGNAKIFPHI
jgi:hypothetical protein